MNIFAIYYSYNMQYSIFYNITLLAAILDAILDLKNWQQNLINGS